MDQNVLFVFNGPTGWNFLQASGTLIRMDDPSIGIPHALRRWLAARPGYLMLQIVRQLLFASLIVCHTAVVLCGPCLHELPGSAHQMGSASKSHRTDHPLQSRSDSKDNCLICQFVAQGQLTVEFYRGSMPQLIAEAAVPTVPIPRLPSGPLPSCPRAPPTTESVLS